MRWQANANVAYEVGLASAWRNPEDILLIHQGHPNHSYSFDVQNLRHVQYDPTTAASIPALADEIVRALNQSSFLAELAYQRILALPATAAPLTMLAPDVSGAGQIAASVAISPQGTHVVYTGRAGDRMQLYLRSLDGPDITPIAEGGSPFFSPDGQWIAFFANGKLKKVPVSGDSPLTIWDAAFGFGGAWSDDGTIVFAGALQGGLSRVSPNGGQPQPFTGLAKGEGAHRWPPFIPGTRDVLFTEVSGFGSDTRVAVQSLDETRHRIIFEGGTSPRYASTGHVLFARAGWLFAVPFDSARRAIAGPPKVLLQGVNTISLSGAAQYALSTNGTLVYLSGGVEDVRRSLVWVDRKGGEQTLSVAERGFETPRIAPNGQRIVVTIREGDADIWVVEAERRVATRITSGEGEDHSAVWTRDSRRVTYSSTRGGQSRVRQKAADGSGSEEELFVTDSHQHVGGWTADGRTLLTEAITPTGSDLHALTVGEKESDAIYLRSTFNEQHPRLSPDNRWVVYASNESGRGVRAGISGRWR